MKKIYSLLTALGFTMSFAMQAQQMNPVTNPTIHPTKKRTLDVQKFTKNKNNVSKTSAVNSAWFCTGDAIDNILLSNAGELNSYPFFPDTMGKFTFSNGDFATFVHALGEVLDPKGAQFTSSATTDFIATPAPQAYSLDSMSIVYAYERKTANNIVDTLIVTVANNNTAANLLGGYYAASTATFVTNYGTDTLQLHRPKYIYTTQDLSAVGSLKFKIPLTVADTSAAFLAEKMFALPSVFSIPAGKMLIASVVFKPGYSYVEGDVISNMGNTFYFASYEENGANTYPMYYDCNLNSPSCDFNNSLIVNDAVRYNTAGGFNGSFIPSYAFAQGYSFEHHLISFRLSAGSVGVNELSQNTFGLTQNMPNPYTKESVVNYNLSKDVNSAVFTVTDVMGRIVSSEKVGTTTGTHTVKLGAYAAGIYYYSLNVDGNVTTKKMIVE